jgi:glycosyltransferase involved in cell wall biosynthesis
MRYGIPVVASNRSAVPEVVGDAAILVDPEDVRQMGAALSRVAVDAELRRDLSERGARRLDSFRWEATIEQTAALFERVAKVGVR